MISKVSGQPLAGGVDKRRNARGNYARDRFYTRTKPFEVCRSRVPTHVGVVVYWKLDDKNVVRIVTKV